MDINEFKNGLRSDKDIEKFDSIFEEEVRKKERTILDEIKKDRLHLEMVNFCANLFIPGLELDQKTGYKLLLVEPLFSLGLKNFDIAAFRGENRSLILIECKHSISNVKEVISDLSQNITETKKHQKELEELIGNQIDQIEYVLCAPAINALDLLNEIADQNVPLCVWGCNMFTKEIRLFSRTNDTEAEIQWGRVHRDKNLNKILFPGILSKLSATRSVPILLSSHMCTLLIHVNQCLYLERTNRELENTFTFSDVYNTLLSQFQNYSQTPEEEISGLTKRMFATAKRKKIHDDLTPEIEELEHKTFKVTGRQNNARIIAEHTQKNYVVRNSQKLAVSSSIERFKKEAGFKGLEDFS